MTTRPSRTNTLDSGDLIVLYKGNDSDYRTISVPDFMDKVKDEISDTEFSSYYLRLDKDETLDLSDNKLSMWIKVLESSPSKALTVVLPSANWAKDGQEVLLNNLSSNPVSVFFGSAGASVIGGEVNVLPSLEARFKYDKTLKQWFRTKFAIGLVTTVVGKEGDVTAEDVSASLLTDTDLMSSFNLKTPSSQNQQEINDFGGATWYAKVGGYELGATVKLANGDIVKSTVANNTVNPDIDMTGWVKTDDASFVVDGDENQHEINKSTIRIIKTTAELFDLKTSGSPIVALKDEQNGGFFRYDPTSTAFVDSGKVFASAAGGRWIRLNSQETYAKDYSNLTYALIGDEKTLKVLDEDLDLVAKNSPQIAFGDGISGNGYSSNVFGTVQVVGGDSRVEKMRIYPAQRTDYGIKLQNPNSANSPAPFLADIRNVLIRDGNGVLLNSVETILSNVRVEGRGIQSAPGEADKERVDYAFRCTSTLRGDTSDSFDTSFSNLFSRGSKVGLSVGGATIGFDGHFVGADTGVSIVGTNNTGLDIYQQTYFGLYTDHSWLTDIDIYGRQGVNIYSPYMLQTGYHNKDETKKVYGINLRGVSRWNYISCPTFRTVDLTKVESLLNFEETAVNNTIVGSTGSYKVSADNVKMLRKQTFIAGNGLWARHNNVPRQNRSDPKVILSGATETLSFTLDFAMSLNQASVSLLKGNWVARTTSGSGDSAYGELWLAVGSSINNLGSKFVVVNSTLASINFEVVSIAVSSSSSYVLEVQIKNTCPLPFTLAAEVQRSIDTLGLTF